jgi:hypothetical protein
LRADTKARNTILNSICRDETHTQNPTNSGQFAWSRDGLLIEERGEIIDAAVWTHRNLAISVVQSDSVKRSVMSVASLSQKSLPR